MDKELKKQWLDALRSGDYNQGKEALKMDLDDGVAYCCLGVLCEIHPEIEFDAKPTRGEYSANHGDKIGSGYLPDYGIIDNQYLSDVIQEDLAIKNDKGESFSEIADWIEENVEEN